MIEYITQNEQAVWTILTIACGGGYFLGKYLAIRAAKEIFKQGQKVEQEKKKES